MTWGVEGFDSTGNLVFDRKVKTIDDADLGKVLGLEDVRYYCGGEYPVDEAGQALLADRFGLTFEPDVEYYIGYSSDYPGQVLRYIPKPAG